MLGLSTKASSNTNDLHIHIPDAFKGVALRVFILPDDKGNDEVEFFTLDELSAMRGVDMSTQLGDKEDYSQW